MTGRPGTAEDGASGTAPARAPLTPYRLAMLMAILLVFAFQQFISFQRPFALARLLGVDDLSLVTKWLGVLASLLLVVVVVEYAWAFIPRLARGRSLLSLEPFQASPLAGRFSLRPVVEGAFPHASPWLVGQTILVVGALNWMQVDRARIATTAIGYCVFLLLLHRSFSHYHLPVMAMVVCLNYEPPTDSDEPPRS